jgi:serine/threonine-protein kinase
VRVSEEPGETSSGPVGVGPGDQIAGYVLEEQIGRGGMAVVFRAHDERLDRRVALKLLAPGLSADSAFRARFIRESRAAAAVDHPNVIPVYDAGDAGGNLFIAMRYVQGGDVRALVADGQALPPARAWHIVTQVAAALDAAHARDLIHRDVKPANMLLDSAGASTATGSATAPDDQHDHVYLSDFGISKQTLASHLTSTGQFVGSLGYIAPEQIDGLPVDGRADQYALACAAFELLSGGPPFRQEMALALINAHRTEQPPSLVTRRPELPSAVDEVLAKAMAKPAAQRYETCAEFAADLGRALGLAPGAVQAGAAPSADQPETQLAAPAPVAAAATAAPGVAAATAAPAPRAVPAPNTIPTGSPAWPQGPAVPAAKKSRGVLVGSVIAVVAIAAAGVGVAFAFASRHTSSSSPPPSSGTSSNSPAAGAAQTQAAAVNNLLNASATSRASLGPVVSAVQSCQNLSADVTQLHTIASQRSTELISARALQVSAIPNGAAAKSELMKALQISLTIDNDYLAWAQQQQNSGCTGTNSSYYQNATSLDSQATADKQAFVTTWNGIAATYRLPTYTAGQI